MLTTFLSDQENAHMFLLVMGVRKDLYFPSPCKDRRRLARDDLPVE